MLLVVRKNKALSEYFCYLNFKYECIVFFNRGQFDFSHMFFSRLYHLRAEWPI